MEQKPSLFHNLLFIFPIMFYYAMEALIVSLFISAIWRILFADAIGNVGYFHIVGAYWIIKMLFFDVFKLITGLSTANTNIRQDMEDNPKDYNNTFEE
jgi:hypothetical protein